MFNSRLQVLAAGVVLGISLGAALGVGIWLGQRSGGQFPLEIPVHAVATDSSESMTIATGMIDGQVEGFFTLDGLTGDLQCAVLNHRTQKIGAIFRINVMDDLGVDGTKRPNFLMVTGTANFAGAAGALRPANSVVYVMDANTGRFGVYGVPWQRDLAARAAPQQGVLVLLDGGMARNIRIRDS